MASYILSLLYSCYYNALDKTSAARRFWDLEDLMHSLWLPLGSVVHVLQSWIHCTRSTRFGGSKHHVGLSLCSSLYSCLCFLWGCPYSDFQDSSHGAQGSLRLSERGWFSSAVLRCSRAWSVRRGSTEGPFPGTVVPLHPKAGEHSLGWDRPVNALWTVQTNCNGSTSSCNKGRWIALS